MRKSILSFLVCAVLSTLQINAQEFLYINGDAIPLSSIKRITSSYAEEHPDLLPFGLKEDENIKLFTSALEVTGLADSLKYAIDETYSVGKDSIDWTTDALVFPFASAEYDNVAYMEHRYFKYTLFICPDSVLKEKYGITDLNGLRAKAKELYDPMYPEDAGVTDETDRRNSLNRFISYHILDRAASYYQLTCVDGGNNTLANNWVRDKWDISDWYETMMPHSIMKFSFPMGSQEGLYINRRGVMSFPDERGVFVRGTKVTEPSRMGHRNTLVNGMYYYIDDIVAYDQQTQEVVLDERMRIDASTLSPDFMTSGARGHYTMSPYEGGKYGMWDDTRSHNNKQRCLGFKPGSAKNFEFDNNTHLHVRPRTLSFWSYQGDEVAILGMFDVTVKLPPVPKGKYELRLGTFVNFPNRGIVQFYIDDVPQGEPVDMCPNGRQLFGWKSDSELANKSVWNEELQQWNTVYDEEAIIAFDKEIHALGWMKGPKSYYGASSESGGVKGSCFRDMDNTIRKVIGHFTSDGKTDHYVRFKQMLESTLNAMNFDYIEIVPSSVYDNPEYDEDQW